MVPAGSLRTAKRFPKKHQKSPVGKSALPDSYARAATGKGQSIPAALPPKTDSNTTGKSTAKNNELREKKRGL